MSIEHGFGGFYVHPRLRPTVYGRGALKPVFLSNKVQ